MKLRKLLRKSELLDERSEVQELFKEWQEIEFPSAWTNNPCTPTFEGEPCRGFRDF